MRRPGQSTDACRVALQRGPLTRVLIARRTAVYMHGRRAFSPETVQRLVEAGHAVREGDIVKVAHA